jgi:general secretion pathway protein G
MLVVLAIIATLAAVIAPSIFRNVGDSKVAAAKTQIDAFAVALGAYRLDNDVYPTTEQGLAALREQPGGSEPPRNWRGPYLEKVIGRDPWGHDYVYLAPGRVNANGFDLYSLGRDGRIGGTGEDADLTSWGGPVER